MYRNTFFVKRTGFTLMEILLVMMILIALFALAMPALFNAQKNARIKEATIRIKNFEAALEMFTSENRGYPTTEQGLDALIFLPDNYGQVQPGTMQPGVPQPGINPMDGGTGTGAFGAGEAVSAGPELLGSGSASSPMNPMGGGMPNPMGGVTGMSGTGMTDPMGGATGMSGMGMTDPMGGVTGMSGTGTGWNQPFSNPQLYTQKRQRPQKYLDSNEIPTDPWGQPYRYDNSMQYAGLNQTGTAQPAIWSAGPDKQDNTDDDIRNWDPVVAQQQILQKQQQTQMQGGGYGGNGMGGTDPFGNPMTNPNPMGTDPFGNPQPNPMGPGTGMPNPVGPGTGMPNPMGPGTGMPNPMGPGTGMPNPMGPGTGTPNPIGPGTGMPNPGM